MKTSKIVFLLTFFALGSSMLVNAQTTKEDEQKMHIPESYQSVQQQLESDAPAGTSSYNIDESQAQTDPGAAPWRNEGETEQLRIYSGSHDGNNLIKIVEVKVPPRSQDPY